MRLIDADVLIEAIRNHCENVHCEVVALNDFYRLAHEHVIEVVNIQNTAFDTEKVVEQLEALKQHNKKLSEGAYLEDDKSFYFCAYTNFARAIDIVKKGGVE